MKISKVIFTVAIFVLLNSSLVYSSDTETVKHDINSPLYFWVKGNRLEKISTKEFKILMSNLEKSIKALKVVSSQISIAEANFSYKTGKDWEIELESLKESIETALNFIKAVNNKPNSMVNSMLLYVTLTDIKSSAYDFERIEQFEKTLNSKHIDLSLWCRAFLKTHLIPLAFKKDHAK